MVKQYSTAVEDRDAIAANPMDLAEAQSVLADMLDGIQEADQKDPPDYESRYAMVLMAMAAAWMCGYSVGYRPADRDDPVGPDWPVVYIELPDGQVSWHMPAHTEEWDGHSTEEKYKRIARFIERHQADDPLSTEALAQ